MNAPTPSGKALVLVFLLVCSSVAAITLDEGREIAKGYFNNLPAKIKTEYVYDRENCPSGSGWCIYVWVRHINGIEVYDESLRHDYVQVFVDANGNILYNDNPKVPYTRYKYTYAKYELPSTIPIIPEFCAKELVRPAYGIPFAVGDYPAVELQIIGKRLVWVFTTSSGEVLFDANTGEMTLFSGWQGGPSSPYSAEENSRPPNYFCQQLQNVLNTYNGLKNKSISEIDKTIRIIPTAVLGIAVLVVVVFLAGVAYGKFSSRKPQQKKSVRARRR